jgi:rod shape determining protein RodA
VNIDIRLLRHLDRLLILAALALTVFGIVMISSAARGFIGPEGAGEFVSKQIIAAILGLAVMLFILLFDYSEFGRMARIIYGLNLGLLTMVLVLGTTVYGSKSWISIGAFQFQPGEVGKVMLILTLGYHLSKTAPLQSIWDLITPIAHVLPLLVLIMLEPDLGTALVFIVIAVAMVYMAGFPGWKIALLMGPPIMAIAGWFYAHIRWGVSMWPLKDHMIERIMVFLDPELDPLGSGYQVMQSKISIGSGGFWGKGLYMGTQNQLGFLPEQHTDFIFSVIGEELGFVGGVSVILLFLVLLWRIMFVASTSKDRFGTLIATGVTAMIGFHVLENVGMTLGVMPVTGIPLPFVSYGGSSLITNLMAIGLVLNVGMRRQTIMF